MGANRKEAEIPICTHRYEKVMGLHRKQYTQPTDYSNNKHSKYKIYNDITTKLRQTQDSNESVQMQIQPEYQSRDRNTRKPTKCMAIHPCTFFCCARAFYSFVVTHCDLQSQWKFFTAIASGGK